MRRPKLTVVPPLDDKLNEIALTAIDIEHAAGLLNTLAEGCSESDEVTDTEWLRAQYLARRIAEHCLAIRESVSETETICLARRQGGGGAA